MFVGDHTTSFLFQSLLLKKKIKVCRSGRFLTSTYISKLGVDPKKFYDKGLREREQ